MADKKISQLTGASTPLAGTEVLPIVQNGSTVKVSIDNLTTGKVVPTGGVKVSGSAMSSATVGSVLEGSWPWQMYRDTESAQSTFVNYVDGGFWYVKSIPFADRNSAPSGVGTDQFSVRDNGNVTVSTGNLAFGTSGKGIDFSANTGAAGMTSELLNWYEEGTFTPTLIASGGGTTAVDIIGRYTRIGRVVYFNIYLNDGANNFGTGSISFGGLPFTCQNSRASTGVVNVITRYVTKPNTSTSLVGWVTPNDTTIALWWSGTDGNNFVALDAAHVTSPTQAVFGLTGLYFV